MNKHRVVIAQIIACVFILYKSYKGG